MYTLRRSAAALSFFVALLLAGCASNPPAASADTSVKQDTAGTQAKPRTGKSKSKTKTQTPPALAGKSYDEIVATGDDAARRGDYRAALLLYGEAQVVDSTAEIWLRIGAAQRHLGLLEGAAFAFRSAAELDKENATAHESLGLVLLALRETDLARTSLTRALEIDDARWQSHNALGVIADLDGDGAAALVHYQAALARYPKSQMLLNNVGYSYYLAGNDASARDYFEAALEQGEYQPATLNLGLLHARERHYRRAVDILAKAIDRATALNDVGFIAISNGDYDDAVKLLEEAIRLSPVHYETAQRNLSVARAGGVQKPG
jgi:Flp pilus assembly protein TadD